MAKKPPKKAQLPAKTITQEGIEIGFPEFAGLGLNINQQAFVKAYVRPDVGFNGTRAYIEAYALDAIEDYLTAKQCSSRLLANVNLQKAISIEIGRLTSDHKQLAKAVLNSWAATAFGDWSDVLNVQGPFVYLRSIEEIPPHMRTQIQSIENTQSGIKVKLCDRDKAKENIAKSLGMFVEVQQSVGGDYESLVHQLAREEAEKQNRPLS